MSWSHADERITMAPYRPQAHSRAADGLQLAADMADMHVQRAVMPGVATTKRLLIEKGFAQHLVVVLPQQLQHPILAGGQPCRPPSPANVRSEFVKLQLALTGHPLENLPLIGDTAENGVHPYAQLRHAEGLGQIIIGSPTEPGDAVLLTAQRRHQQHRHPAATAQLLQYLQSVQPGKQNAHQYQIVVIPLGQTQPLAAVMAEGNRMTGLLQKRPDMTGKHEVIFYNEDTGNRGGFSVHGRKVLS